MRVGFVGLGKLGLPVALAIESKGHLIAGFDVNPSVGGYVRGRRIPYTEVGVPALLESTKLEVVDSIDALVAWEPDIVFVPVQTPHDPAYEGVTRLPDERVDFDYSYLTAACSDLFAALRSPTIVAVISTVLPGTIDREIRPLMNENVRLVYTPQFIAMGTTVEDFLHPEFTLIGVDDPDAGEFTASFIESMTGAPTLVTDIPTAEGIKVAYNSFITAKTVLGNLWGELADKLGMNADDIYRAFELANRRLCSPKYLKAGVGDGGGCHPRDNIALSWLARETDLSFDLFEALMVARENHMEWIAEIVADVAEATGLPVCVFGRAFKPGTNITTGSPATLLVNLLTELGHEPVVWWDERVPTDLPAFQPNPVGVYVIATDHGDWPPVPTGSVVVDPFGSYPDLPGVRVERLGRRPGK